MRECVLASDTRYNSGFYQRIRAGCQASAAAVVPVVLEHTQPITVVDVGCGEGWWAQAFLDAEGGADEATGIDGDYVDIQAPDIYRIAYDLADPDLAQRLVDFEGFDLAVSLEVAEHLPVERGPSFIADLCALAPVVLFSAAQPHQGGTGHVNCQPPRYWASLFNEQGFEVSGALRWLLWENLDVEPWYRSNLLIAAREPDDMPHLFDTPLAPPWHVTAPDLWLTR